MMDTANGGGGDIGGTNGGGMSEEELERQRMRPADVDADMREMGRRKRVDAILNSKTFKSELDRLVEVGLIDGNSVGGCLQQISDMMGIRTPGGNVQAAQCVQPIADLRGAESAQFTKQEKMLRCRLASLFRVLDLRGWTAGSHLGTLRISQDAEHFLVNPHGLLCTEITASSLLKTDMQGNLLHPGSTGLALNAGGYAQHAAVHAARPDLRCVLTVRQPAVVAVSALRAGLMPLTEDAAVLGQVSVHRPAGDGDTQRLAADLGVSAKVLLIQNRGALCCGETVDEAFYLLSRLVTACENQVRMLPLGADNLQLLDEQQQQDVYDAARRPPSRAADSPSHRASAWRLGQLEFEALMRQMDNAGYRTGHVYQHAVRADGPPGHQSDVEYPPAASGYSFDTEDIFSYSPMRKMFAGARAGERTRWLNSPNVYQKLEVLETGTSEPKTITKVSGVKVD